MIIKKFTAKTEEEAINLAKAELGENIVIMNVKTAAQKGFFSFLKKPIFSSIRNPPNPLIAPQLISRKPASTHPFPAS